MTELEVPLIELEVLSAVFVAAVVDCVDEVLPVALRLPEAVALPEPLKLPDAEVELEFEEFELEGCEDAELLPNELEGDVVEDDDEGVDCVEDDELGDSVEVPLVDWLELLLEDGVEELELEEGCWVEVWAWTHSAAAKRNGVPTAMNFNGRFMMMISRLLPGLPRVCAIPQAGVVSETGGKPGQFAAERLRGRFSENSLLLVPVSSQRGQVRTVKTRKSSDGDSMRRRRA